MKYLITRCTVFDMAGVAMIQGAMIGLSELDPEAEFAALVWPENDANNPVCRTYRDPFLREDAFRWADVVLDIGGLCKGEDPYRLDYIKLAKKRDLPYIYMSQSFWNPDEEIIKDIPIVARGENSAKEIERITGKKPPIAADLSFLIDPLPWNGKIYKRCYTTHQGKQFGGMFVTCREEPSIQIILKTTRDLIWEPFLGLPIFHGSPAEIFGLIETLEEVHTARYHTGVGAIMFGKPLILYVDYKSKYDDLRSFAGMTRAELKKSAMISCEVVMEVLGA